MRILVTFALDAEFAPWRRLRKFHQLTDREGQVFEALIGRAKVHVTLTGVGSDHAARAVHRALSESFAICISAGFAGGLKSKYALGDILIASEVMNERGTKALPCTDRPIGFPGCEIKRADKFISMPRLISSPVEKRELGKFADAVDMETFAVVEAAATHGIKTIAIRVISDTVDEEIPIDFDRTTDEHGRVSTERMIRQIAMNPVRLPGLIRFGMRARSSAEVLATCLDRFITWLSFTKHGWVPNELQEIATR
jgi:adenosylhomocysteine nucleosidase